LHKFLLISILLFCVYKSTLAGDYDEDTIPVVEKIIKFKNSNNRLEKINLAFSIVDKYIKYDYDDSAQTWIYTLIELNSIKMNDTIDYFIHSRQTEIFYFSNLMQFAGTSANKTIAIAQKIKDSAFIADAFAFKSYIYEELDSIAEAKSAAVMAKRFFPKIAKVYKRSLIRYSQIINQIAQLYVKLRVTDSAYYYNTMAYSLALQDSTQRAINMCNSTFGNIFIQLHKYDSALYFFKKSKEGCLLNRNYDIILWNTGREIIIAKNDNATAYKLLVSGFALIDSLKISSFFQKLFYKDALSVFGESKNAQAISIIQERMIALNAYESKDGNKLIQDISQKYVESENALLRLHLKELNNKRTITTFQVLSILLLASLAVLTFYFLYRRKKNKLLEFVAQQHAIEQERIRLARELHDGLGSMLSGIKHSFSSIKNNIHLDNKQDVDFDASIEKLNISIKEIRNISHSMMDADSLLHNGLINALRDYCRSLTKPGILKVNFEELALENMVLKDEQTFHVFRIVQELLQNILKHSQATEVIVQLSKNNNELSITVEDNGVGFDNANINAKKGIGFKNIQARLKIINGSIDVRSAINKGTSIYIQCPVNLKA
jgi:signal transduction histidine kinase